MQPPNEVAGRDGHERADAAIDSVYVITFAVASRAAVLAL
jgi:hypothetical protein